MLVEESVAQGGRARRRAGRYTTATLWWRLQGEIGLAPACGGETVREGDHVVFVDVRTLDSGERFAALGAGSTGTEWVRAILAT